MSENTLCVVVFPDTPGMDIKQTQSVANGQPPAGGREKNIFNIKSSKKIFLLKKTKQKQNNSPWESINVSIHPCDTL